MVPKEAHFDDASFLVVMKVINVFLNGIIYFLLHQLMHLDTLYRKVYLLTYLC